MYTIGTRLAEKCERRSGWQQYEVSAIELHGLVPVNPQPALP